VTYEDLLARVIADGIAEVREAYADPKDHHKRDGAIEGFEACRGKTPPELLELWAEAERQVQQLFRQSLAQIVAGERNRSGAENYWKQRYKALQLEFVLNVVSVGLGQDGLPPLLAHLPTARGAMKYAALVGVRGGLRAD
jgi:hypothetical protein